MKQVTCPYCKARFKHTHVCYDAPDYPGGIVITRRWVQEQEKSNAHS